MRIAISGVGVAGPTLAYWLLRGGHEPTLIESAPELRTGGYMIDFWGIGYAVAEKMGLVDQVRAAGFELEEARWVDRRGRKTAAISAKIMRRELGDRFTSLPRGALAEVLYRAVEGRAETLFDDSVERLHDLGERVGVKLASGAERVFDLVIGADGLHSKVRALGFGSQAQFERPLGYHVAAFECAGYTPRDELVYVSRGVAGRQISRFALRGGRTMFLFVFASERLATPAPAGLAARKQAIAEVFADVEWEWPAIRRALMAAEDIYFDQVSQVVLPAWSKGRIGLVGDAAACVSLVAGEGAGLAMAEAYVLAHELQTQRDPAQALIAYEARTRQFVDGKQKAARDFAASFAPRTALGVWLRDQAVRLMALPGLPGLLVGPQMRDDFQLPDDLAFPPPASSAGPPSAPSSPTIASGEAPR